jgi:hypothetical protein
MYFVVERRVDAERSTGTAIMVAAMPPRTDEKK